MTDFTARFERLELKFLIEESQAEQIRSQIEPYCEPDPHCREAARGRLGHSGYPISSLYLDTPALAFHEAKERGDPDRIKLRVRTYSDTSPATLEIKRHAFVLGLRHDAHRERCDLVRLCPTITL